MMTKHILDGEKFAVDTMQAERLFEADTVLSLLVATLPGLGFDDKGAITLSQSDKDRIASGLCLAAKHVRDAYRAG